MTDAVCVDRMHWIKVKYIGVILLWENDCYYTFFSDALQF